MDSSKDKLWPKLAEKTVYQNYRKIISRTFQLPDLREIDYEVFDGPDYVVVAAFTTDNQLIITKQFRPGPADYLLGFPSGMIDEGEKAVEAAKREMLEETGYQVGKIEFLKETKLNYGIFRQQAFIATGCHKVSEQKLDSTEFIEVELWKIEDWLNMVKDPTDNRSVNADVGFLALDKIGLL